MRKVINIFFNGGADIRFKLLFGKFGASFVFVGIRRGGFNLEGIRADFLSNVIGDDGRIALGDFADRIFFARPREVYDENFFIGGRGRSFLDGFFFQVQREFYLAIDRRNLL